eukprot:3278874-Amphidinium_carterae.1
MVCLKTIVAGLVYLSWTRCHTFIARCAGGWPQQQFAGRAASRELVQRLREGPKMRDSRRLSRVSRARA